jgi:hypothetical protein
MKFTISFRKQWMQTNAASAETIDAHTSSGQLMSGIASRFMSFIKPAAGIDNRNESSSFSLMSTNSIAVMETVPSMTANFCARPISRLVYTSAGQASVCVGRTAKAISDELSLRWEEILLTLE